MPDRDRSIWRSCSGVYQFGGGAKRWLAISLSHKHHQFIAKTETHVISLRLAKHKHLCKHSN